MPNHKRTLADNSDEHLKTLIDHRVVLVNFQSEQYRTFDKSILTVSGGALALSIAFSDKFGGQNPQISGWLLGAWAAFGIAIFISIASYLSASADLNKAIDEVDAEIRGEADELPSGNVFKNVTKGLNIAALLLFLIGVGGPIQHARVVGGDYDVNEEVEQPNTEREGPS
ncbi:hypothetical protein [Acuticoccus sp. I52.16.1]|uniref:hypothetical protein n=1 Tax=Acuticoccus sp. I52.16.1 TaxID=2928472 RepID=UPI001FD0E448|nr:hypothetical protein [Acuticoccus sp. I52.16.1]UOM37042.1 hypothetical protein MRB58_23430 [Acuticoccus sp. I52.16.1]